jgi:hypothetical protein
MWRLRNLWNRVVQRVTADLARFKTELLWRNRARGRQPHSLSGQLVVSLTSYGSRFRTLDLTIKCLLSQTIKSDRTVLWLSEQDLEILPEKVKSLKSFGLEIRTTVDIGPYTKIIPSLNAYPGTFVATADDDIYYEPNWLRKLVAAYDPGDSTIICHRAHRVRLDSDGRPLPYSDWDYEVPTPEKSRYLFPTGVGGVLYFPNALPAEALVEERFKALSSKNDDLWLYWMEMLAGLSITTLGQKRPLINWSGSQRVGLYKTNTGAGAENDICIGRLFSAYGLPLEPKSTPERSVKQAPDRDGTSQTRCG